MEEYNNNDMGIELPTLKNDQEENNVFAAPETPASPVLNEPVASPIAMPTVDMPAVNPEPTFAYDSQVVSTSMPMPEVPVQEPVIPTPVVETPAPVIETPVMPEVVSTPVMPTVESAPVAPVANEPVAPTTMPEVPTSAPAAQSTYAASSEQPTINIAPQPVNPTPVMNETPAIETSAINEPVNNVAPAPAGQMTNNAANDNVVEASKTAKIIGTVVCLAIIVLLAFWFVRNYLLIK